MNTKRSTCILRSVIPLITFALGPNLAKSDELSVAITDVDGLLSITASGDNVDTRVVPGPVVSGSPDVGIILYSPGQDVAPIPDKGYGFVFGSPIDPFAFVGIHLLQNPEPFFPLEIDVAESTDAGEGCSPLVPCTVAEDYAVYTLVDLTYTDGTVDPITFQWIVTPEPTSIILLGTVVFGLGLATRRKFLSKAATEQIDRQGFRLTSLSEVGRI